MSQPLTLVFCRANVHDHSRSRPAHHTGQLDTHHPDGIHETELAEVTSSNQSPWELGSEVTRSYADFSKDNYW